MIGLLQFSFEFSFSEILIEFARKCIICLRSVRSWLYLKIYRGIKENETGSRSFRIIVLVRFRFKTGRLMKIGIANRNDTQHALCFLVCTLIKHVFRVGHHITHWQISFYINTHTHTFL